MQGPVHGGVEAALAALLVLRPTELSRNRHFRLHSSREGARARARAAAIRGLVRQLTGAHGPARGLSVDVAEAKEGADGGATLRYALPRVAARRSVQLSGVELAILRVALEQAGVRLLPAPLLARADDRAHVEELLAQAMRLRSVELHG